MFARLASPHLEFGYSKVNACVVVFCGTVANATTVAERRQENRASSQPRIRRVLANAARAYTSKQPRFAVSNSKQ